MHTILCTILICCLPWNAEAKLFQPFFIPEDVQTILNIAYSRLPPVKFGNDQRFGVGFRLGRNADFQALLELGPQSETMPLGNPDNSFGKRENRPKKYYNWEKPKKPASKYVDDKTKKSNHYKTTPSSINAMDKTKKEKYSKVQKRYYKHTTSKKPNNFNSKFNNDKDHQKMTTSTYKPIVYVKNSTNKLLTQNQLDTSTFKSAIHNKGNTTTAPPLKNQHVTSSTNRPETLNKVNNSKNNFTINNRVESSTNKSANHNQLTTPTTQLQTSTNKPVTTNQVTVLTNKSVTHNKAKPQSNKDLTTHNQIKSTTNKPMINNVMKASTVKPNTSYKRPDSILGMFINWLSGFARV